MALRIAASTVSEIRWALKLVNDYGIKMVITPATEAWVIPDETAKRNVLLTILSRDRSMPDERRNSSSDAKYDAAGTLQRAGIHVSSSPPAVNSVAT